mgnify:CR=1 FL=1
MFLYDAFTKTHSKHLFIFSFDRVNINAECLFEQFKRNSNETESIASFECDCGEPWKTDTEKEIKFVENK